MEAHQWIGNHWFELFQTVGIIGGLLFTAYTTQREERSRKISNLIAIKEQHREIWKELYDRPELSRVLKNDIDLKVVPVSEEETLFVKLLILHLDTVHRAVLAGMLVGEPGRPANGCQRIFLTAYSKGDLGKDEKVPGQRLPEIYQLIAGK